MLRNHGWEPACCLLFSALFFLVSAAAQDKTASPTKASPQEIVDKVQAAANTLAKAGPAGIAQFNQKQSSWVWKDTYIFVVDCNHAIIAAHPVSPELVGKDATSLLDTKGYPFFWRVCDALSQPQGLWLQYWWPKPGQKEGSRKITYALRAGSTPYVVGAGVYDDRLTIAELEKLTRGSK